MIDTNRYQPEWDAVHESVLATAKAFDDGGWWNPALINAALLALVTKAQAVKESEMPCYYAWMAADRTREFWDDLLAFCPDECACDCPPCIARRLLRDAEGEA